MERELTIESVGGIGIQIVSVLYGAIEKRTTRNIKVTETRIVSVFQGAILKADDHKDLGYSDSDCFCVTGSDPKPDDHKDQGDSDPNCFFLTGGDTAFFCVSRSDLTLTKRSREEKL